jgi:hypothetical protein
MSDLHERYHALHLRTQAERLRSAANLQPLVIRGFALRLADNYDALAARAVDSEGRFQHSNDDHQ